MVKRIALSGRPLSGKSTLARFMAEKYDYRHASMSGFLVEQYTKLRSMAGSPVSTAEVIANKEAYRRDLQNLGDQYSLQDPIGCLRYMQQVLAACGAWQAEDEPVVLEAIRGEVQASAARALGFVVVELVVDEETMYQRAGSPERYHRLRSSVLARPDLESGVPSASIRLTNEMLLEDMAQLLFLLPKEGLSHGPADQPFRVNSFAGWSSYQ